MNRKRQMEERRKVAAALLPEVPAHDTKTAQARALQELLAKHGHDVSTDTARRDLLAIEKEGREVVSNSALEWRERLCDELERVKRTAWAIADSGADVFARIQSLNTLVNAINSQARLQGLDKLEIHLSSSAAITLEGKAAEMDLNVAAKILMSGRSS